MPFHDYRATDVPSWLQSFKPGDPAPIASFLTSRVVFYPGSGTDGSAVQFFGSRHLAHCFIYVDYGMSQDALLQELDGRYTRFAGYHSLARVQLGERDLVPNGWQPHASSVAVDAPARRFAAATSAAPYGFLEVMERDEGIGRSHGPERIAILFLGADGVATYDALFCQPGSSPCFALVLQDHGFGGNYTSFGANGLLARIAKDTGAFPELVWCAENTDVWPGYEPEEEIEPAFGGVHRMQRELYRYQG